MSTIAKYSEQEIKLFRSVGFEYFQHIDPIASWKGAAEVAFAHNSTGPDIEALRRGYKAMFFDGQLRKNAEFDKLIEF